MVLNNLSTPTTVFSGGKTFKRKNQCISELDICLLTVNLLASIVDFKIHQAEFLPSDHAPISFEIMSRGMDMNQMCLRAGQLGQHWPWGTRKSDEVEVRKPVRFNDIDKDFFCQIYLK